MEPSEFGLSEKAVKHYTEDGLLIILDRHYNSGTNQYSGEILNQLVGERQFQYEQGQITRVLNQVKTSNTPDD